MSLCNPGCPKTHDSPALALDPGVQPCVMKPSAILCFVDRISCLVKINHKSNSNHIFSDVFFCCSFCFFFHAFIVVVLHLFICLFAGVPVGLHVHGGQRRIRKNHSVLAPCGVQGASSSQVWVQGPLSAEHHPGPYLFLICLFVLLKLHL